MKHESRIHKTIVCVFDMMSAFLMQCIVHTESNKNQTNNIYKPCIPCIVFPDTDLMFLLCSFTICNVHSSTFMQGNV